MYNFDKKIRVRYAETDQMSYVYYGVYAQYYEVGRVELLRSLGISYKTIESMGYALPVVNLNINYKKPAFYDDELTIKTSILKLPTSKITFFYQIYNEENYLINTGEVTLAFVNKITGRVCSAPDFILDKLQTKLQ
jgi:acyl-CoA thioester hydrolase